MCFSTPLLALALALALLLATTLAAPLVNIQIAQPAFDSVQPWEKACTAAGGKEQCNSIAVTVAGTLLAAAGPCDQQNSADSMINLAKQLNHDADMIKFAQIFAQQPRSSPTHQAAPYCQSAPANTELNGLFPCQFASAAFRDADAIPFGRRSPVNPSGSCPAHPSGPIPNGAQLLSIVQNGDLSTVDPFETSSPLSIRVDAASSDSVANPPSDDAATGFLGALPTPSTPLEYYLVCTVVLVSALICRLPSIIKEIGVLIGVVLEARGKVGTALAQAKENEDAKRRAEDACALAQENAEAAKRDLAAALAQAKANEDAQRKAEDACALAQENAEAAKRDAEDARVQLGATEDAMRKTEHARALAQKNAEVAKRDLEDALAQATASDDAMRTIEAARAQDNTELILSQLQTWAAALKLDGSLDSVIPAIQSCPPSIRVYRRRSERPCTRDRRRSTRHWGCDYV